LIDYHLSLPTNHSDHFKTYVENHCLIWLKDEVTDLPSRVRHGDWKLVSTVPTEWQGDEAQLPLETMELYYLAEDPYETTTLASEHPEKTAALLQELLRLIREGRTQRRIQQI